MEENLYNRIGEADLNPTYKDGQVYQHTDVNNMLSILKLAINENYYDIQRLWNGEKTVGNADQLDGATLSRYLNEELQPNDNKVPSSQQVMSYINALFESFSPPIRGIDYWTEEDKLYIIDETANRIIDELKGEYDADTTYEKLNIVFYQGSTYFALQQTTGNLPTNTTYWQLLAKRGDSAYELYQKHGGTLSEDVWLDEFTNAENFYNKAEVDNKLSLRDLLLSQKPYYFNTVADMKAYDLGAGSVAITLGYSEVNDKGGAIYKIRAKEETDTIDEGFIISINSNTVAELILEDGIKREKVPNINYFKVESNKLSGLNMALMPIEQQSNKSSCVDVQYNECLIQNLRIKNTNNYSNKTAINFLTPGQRQKVDSVYIDSGFKYGMNIPNAYYSQFNNVWVRGDIGIQIGNPSSPGNWIGVLDFNACHINGSKLGIKEIATDTNTICFDKCSFEGNIKCVENSGKMYFKNTYFGDTNLTTTDDLSVLDANAGSETYFDDCTIGIGAKSDDTTGKKISLFNLKSANSNGSKVFVNGGILVISNNSNTNSASSIYDSDSNLNEIYLDNASFIPSTTNTNHNQFPYILLNGYSPLRSLHPIKNYVINGTLRNPIMNTYSTTTHDSNAEIDSTLTNPFGGKVLTYTKNSENVGAYGSGFAVFNYKIPKHLVGKKMVLEVYAWASDTYLCIRALNLGLTNVYYNFNIGTYSNRTRPRMRRVEVTPTAEEGRIDLFSHWNNPNTSFSHLVAGVVLKEYRYKDYLSCYEDQDLMMSKEIPTNTTDAVKGDIVYATSDSACTGTGWIFNGTSWVVYNDLS